MAAKRKMLVVELNEVPYEIVDYYCAQRPESTLAKTLVHCRQYTTISPDAQPLSPWITWPTLHRGVPDTVHGLHSLGQNHQSIDQTYPSVWDLLSRDGVSAGIVGSLHTYPLPDNAADYAFYVPDCFASGSECYPAELAKFQKFNLSMVAQSGRNVSTTIDWKSARAFLASARSLGLRPSTIGVAARQLASERRNPWKKTRRRTMQTLFAFDLFLSETAKTKPQYAAVFSNHVASSMHRYWAAAFPDQYEVLKFDDAWLKQYAGEILYTMDITDRLFSDAKDFVDANPEYQLVVSSSMGQAPAKTRPLRRKMTLTDTSKFMAAAGFSSTEFEQRSAMDANIGVIVAPERVEELLAFLGMISIKDKKFKAKLGENGFVSWYVPGVNLGVKFDKVRVGDEILPLSALGLTNLQVEDEADSTAYHIPEGIFVIYDPQDLQGADDRAEVSTLDVAPFFLAALGVGVPTYMNAPGAISIGASEQQKTA